MADPAPFAHLHEGRTPPDRSFGLPGHASAFGLTVADATDWKPVLELFYDDRVQAALARAQEVGLGIAGRYLSWYRLIEAEALTRARATFLPVAPWLEIEYVPEEIEPNSIQHAASIAIGACVQVANRLAYPHQPPTLIAFLAAETDAPWTPGRDGMCLDKRPYEKICVPSRLVSDLPLLARVVAHEFAHVVVINAAQGMAPVWLSEAIALTMEGPRPTPPRPPQRWKEPKDLEDAFRADRRDLAGMQEVADAYAQSAIIGRVLGELRGDAGLADLLGQFAKMGTFDHVAVAAGLATPADLALRHVYGIRASELFSRARA